VLVGIARPIASHSTSVYGLPAMIVSRELLCTVYRAIALLALVATWAPEGRVFRGRSVHRDGAVLEGDAADAASVSITVDIFLFGLAVAVWMVAEARARHPVRLDLRGAGGPDCDQCHGAALSRRRERRLQALQPVGEPTVLTPGDLVGLLLFALPALILSVWSLLR